MEGILGEKHRCFGAVSSVAIPKRKNRTSLTEGEFMENYSVIANKSVLSSYFCFSSTTPFSPHSCKRWGNLSFCVIFHFPIELYLLLFNVESQKLSHVCLFSRKLQHLLFLISLGSVFVILDGPSHSLFFHSFNCSHRS